MMPPKPPEAPSAHARSPERKGSVVPYVKLTISYFLHSCPVHDIEHPKTMRDHTVLHRRRHCAALAVCPELRTLRVEMLHVASRCVFGRHFILRLG